MPSIQHILVPYDFSSQDQQIVPFVRSLAVCFAARVTLFSVVPPTFEVVSSEMGGPAIRAGDDAAGWRQNLQLRLDGAVIDGLAGLPVDRIADCGDPALRIVDFASNRGVDLIMMPTHGVGPFRSFLVGSVAAKVLHDAKCAVWTAAHAEIQSASALPKTILCAIDGSEATPSLVRWAVEFARVIGARLSLLHVVGPVSDWPSLESERRLQEHVRDEAHHRITGMLRAVDVPDDVRTAIGGIVQTVTEQAKEEHADLIIIGRGRVPEPFGRLRTHAFGIIQRSPCPVLSV